MRPFGSAENLQACVLRGKRVAVVTPRCRGVFQVVFSWAVTRLETGTRWVLTHAILGAVRLIRKSSSFAQLPWRMLLITSRRFTFDIIAEEGWMA